MIFFTAYRNEDMVLSPVLIGNVYLLIFMKDHMEILSRHHDVIKFYVLDPSLTVSNDNEPGR